MLQPMYVHTCSHQITVDIKSASLYSRDASRDEYGRHLEGLSQQFLTVCIFSSHKKIPFQLRTDDYTCTQRHSDEDYTVSSYFAATVFSTTHKSVYQE